ncbi:hypothetical protein [Acinetobacter pittii]|uniref:hypothetical protein n=1 Tax=Acinetobacter pittii TaxID=48296 RepID=UPI000A386416|nr:hypothetical protein [Acinetobacter pittii]OTU22139.1 hypothetical protein CAT62_06095 [Acinetobacter pittii]
MDNYKIKVTDEVSNTEIQEALFELGCEWFGSTNEVKPLANCWIDVGSNGRLTWSFHGSDEKELTLPQLRDLVVLKRNDVKDATHADEDRRAYLDSEGKYHFYIHAEHKWEYSLDVQYVGKHLKPINKPQDPALISGADALRALADGKEVEYNWLNQKSSKWMLISEELKQFNLYEILSATTEFGAIKFRLKPQTIKLELELPKPFEPEVGQEVWFIDDNSKCGYSRSAEYGSDIYSYFGWWRTEDEIKQVVEQLRKIRGTNS